MRVALDARELQPRPLGGVGRTLHHLVPRLAAQVDLLLLTDARRPPIDEYGLPHHSLRAPIARGAAWLQLPARRWLRGFDGVFHCPFYGLPYGLPVPGVVTIHDVTFEDHSAWFTRAQRLAFRVQARHAAKVARSIVTPSEHIRGRVATMYDVAPARLVVARPGVDPVFSPERRDASRRRPLGLDGPYVVALGGAARRNHQAAVAGWRLLRARGFEVRLVLVGTTDTPPEPGLVVAGRLADDDWAAVLAGAEAFCYTTEYEGFGMPALEACACGTPVVAARVGSLPEVLGDAAAWCEDLGPDAVATALADVLDRSGPLLRAAALARAAAAPGWDDCAAAHLTAYRLGADGP